MVDLVSRRTLLAGTAAAIGAATLPAAAQAQAQLNFRYANASNEQNIANVWAAEFFKKVEERTQGRVRTQLMLNAGGEQTIVEGISLGTLDMAVTGYTGLKEFDALYFPYLLRDVAHGVRVMAGPIGEKCRQAMMSRYNIRMVGVGNTGPFVLATKNRVTKWSDLRGMKIRVPPFAAYIEAVRQLGANPTPVPFNEIYLALQQGVVDGVVTILNIMFANKFIEVCKYVVQNDFGVGLDKFVISQRSYMRMSAEQRKVFDDTFAETMPGGIRLALDNASKDFDNWKRLNGPESVNMLDPAEMERTLRPGAERFANEAFGTGAFDTISRA
ncbi:MAG: TRAP transporter substrate-binding protein [Alphaproteobacteria bacterium]|nr:TRAP transporter substrate-binding protein [Alphaproteobacteria bacterium]